MGGINVLSNAGGHTGLWFGMSLPLLMELLGVFYRILRCEYNTVRRAIEKD